jgi:hypothetical protein
MVSKEKLQDLGRAVLLRDDLAADIYERAGRRERLRIATRIYSGRRQIHEVSWAYKLADELIEDM